jgi:phycobilisome rod-core linker protein
LAIPFLSYAPSSQNARVASFAVGDDDQPVVFTTENILSSVDMDNLVEAAYRQIFFHAFKIDRLGVKVTESQLRSGQITVRDFIRGLLVSDKYKRSFYDLNNNYRFVEQTVQRVLGRDVYSEREKIAWSIVICTKGYNAFIDQILDSEEYLENFGYDTVPYQRRRSLPGRELGEVPFNIKSPRYDEYYRSIYGFPQMVWQNATRSYQSADKIVKAGDPSQFLGMARSLSYKPANTGRVSTANISLSMVPYRKK